MVHDKFIVVIGESGKDRAKAVCALRRGGKKPKLFMYDVTSGYLEGEQNYIGEYVYILHK